MGRLHLRRFEESFSTCDFYRCKTCRTDIALLMAERRGRPVRNSGLEGVQYFTDVMNVVIDEKVLRQAGPHTVADIHCVKCMDLIGYKFIYVSTDVERIIRDGTIQLKMAKLEWCDRSDARAALQRRLDNIMASLRQGAAAGMEEQEEEPAAVVQEQAAEMGQQEQAEAAAVGEQEEPAEAAEQEQDVEMEEQEPAEAAELEQDVEMGEQEPAETAEQEQDVAMGELEQAAAVEEQLPEDP